MAFIDVFIRQENVSCKFEFYHTVTCSYKSRYYDFSGEKKKEKHNLNSFEDNRFKREKKAISTKEKKKKSLRQKMEDKENEHP